MLRQSVPGHLSALGEWPGGEAIINRAQYARGLCVCVRLCTYVYIDSTARCDGMFALN